VAALLPSSGRHPFPEVIEPLTSIRFFLALGVVLFHYQLTWTLPPEAAGLLNRARLGVDVFFILSGFILTHVYLQGDAAPDYRRFIVARFARIYPAHLFILLAMLALVLGADLAGVALQAGRFAVPDFLMTLLLVQAWFPHQDAEWNGPSWSLSAEWFAYLIFPAYAWIALRLRHRPWLIIGLAILMFVVLDAAYRVVFGPVLPRAEGSMGILRILPEFLYGIGLYYLGQGIRVSQRASLVLTAGSSALLLLAMQYPLDDRIIVLLAGPFLLALALLAKSGARTFLSARPWLFAGEASFALYMVHIPVLMVWRNAAEKLHGLPSNYRMSPWELALLLALSLAAAAFVHVAVERPGRRIIRRLFARRRPTPRPESGRFVHSDQGDPL
jgi:peptidoglycan/LPS O-acetylase OafA/YrhL